MLSAIGLIIAIALLIVMIVKGVDMITASVVTAAIILVTSGLDFWEGLLKTFSEGAGSFCSSWFLILGQSDRAGYQGRKIFICCTWSQKSGADHYDLHILYHTAGY